ncbi:MAG: hypothetical protein HYU64_07485 [Armatimonadetes bacterium]|nr:hypothetical protein [Armatimonadota bacterium]
MRKCNESGMATAVALLTLVVVVMLGLALGSVSMRHTHFQKRDKGLVEAFFAAEAGIQDCLYRLEDTHYLHGLPESGRTFSGTLPSTGRAYSVYLANNFWGTAPLSSKAGPIPPHRIYIESVGYAGPGGVRKKIVAHAVNAYKFDYVICTGGDVFINNSTNLYGTIRSNGDIHFAGTADLFPQYGKGSALAGGNVDIQSRLNVKDAGQWVKARGAVHLPIKVTGIPETHVVSQDISSDTTLLINDGTVNPPEGDARSYIPNPDADALLNSPDAVLVTAPAVYDSGVFDLAGKIWIFAGGVEFRDGAAISGAGTIVVLNSASAVFNIQIGNPDVPLSMNVLSVSGANGIVGTGAISFNKSTVISGLIYSHGSVSSSAAFKLRGGAIMTYGDAPVSLGSGAFSEYRNDYFFPYIPGFDPWLNGGRGLLPQVTAWIEE